MSQDPERSGGLGRGRRLLLGAAAVVLLLAVATASWYGLAGRAADQVLVRWSDGDPVCTGTTVRDSTGDDTPSPRPRRIVAVRTMSCTITVDVVNRSSRTLHLEQAVAPYAGRGTGAVVRMDASTPPSSDGGRRAAGSTIDATLPLDERVREGERGSFSIHLVFNPRGCDDGGTFSVEGWPRVSSSILGRHFSRSAEETFAFERTGRTPGCRAPECAVSAVSPVSVAAGALALLRQQPARVPSLSRGT